MFVTRAWLTGVLLFQGAALSETIRFDHAAPGSLPAGWSVTMTHTGGAPRWEIVRDDSAPRETRCDRCVRCRLALRHVGPKRRQVERLSTLMLLQQQPKASS